jgi:hypothetical protein
LSLGFVTLIGSRPVYDAAASSGTLLFGRRSGSKIARIVVAKPVPIFAEYAPDRS